MIIAIVIIIIITSHKVKRGTIVTPPIAITIALIIMKIIITAE